MFDLSFAELVIILVVALLCLDVGSFRDAKIAIQKTRKKISDFIRDIFPEEEVPYIPRSSSDMVTMIIGHDGAPYPAYKDFAQSLGDKQDVSQESFTSFFQNKIVIEDRKWKDYDIYKILYEINHTILDKLNIFDISFISYELLLTNDIGIRKLNKIHRNKDKSTNVLSFPMHDLNDAKLRPELEDGIIKSNSYLYKQSLGNIAISIDTIYREITAKLPNSFDMCDFTRETANHFTHLIIHAILHLIGYNHIKDNDAFIMETLEIEILRKLNISNPYIDN